MSLTKFIHKLKIAWYEGKAIGGTGGSLQDLKRKGREYNKKKKK